MLTGSELKKDFFTTDTYKLLTYMISILILQGFATFLEDFVHELTMR
jgi:hypothetical protein